MRGLVLIRLSWSNEFDPTVMGALALFKNWSNEFDPTGGVGVFENIDLPIQAKEEESGSCGR